MYKRRQLILFGGPSASGKSTIISNMLKRYPQLGYYKRNKAFFDCAREKGISDLRVYDEITPQEANRRFVAECCIYDILLSDVHYGVQLQRDRMFSLGQIGGSVEENYVPTITPELITMLRTKNIDITAVLLIASPEVLLSRAKERVDTVKKLMRASSIIDVEKELEAEKYFWSKLKQQESIRALCYDTSKESKENIMDDIAIEQLGMV